MQQWGLPSARSEKHRQDWKARSVLLRMSLVNITPDTDGTTLTLRIQGESNDPLPAFSGTVEYGQNSGNNRQLSGNQCAESID
ncbi:DUF3251 domain-containing protein [Escherichia coli]